MEHFTEALISPFEAFFASWRELRRAQARAVLETRRSLLVARREALNSRVGTTEQLLRQLSGGNRGSSSSGAGNPNGGATDGGGTVGAIANGGYDESG